MNIIESNTPQKKTIGVFQYLQCFLGMMNGKCKPDQKFTNLKPKILYNNLKYYDLWFFWDHDLIYGDFFQELPLHRNDELYFPNI